jgi:uncharacterized protein (DUF983 family)
VSDHPTNEGIGFFGLLFLIFLTLKLCHVIEWSWWWVSAPLWMPLALAVALAVVAALHGLAVAFADWVNEEDQHP